MTYPEHEKLKAIQEQSQAIGEFLDWLRSDPEDGGKGVRLLVWQEWDEDGACTYWQCVGGRLKHTKDAKCPRCGGTGRVERHHENWVPLGVPVNKLLAEFFKIDLGRLEAEKRAMLEALRNAS